MEARKLLRELENLDVRLWAEGGKLRYDAPKGIMSPEILSRIRTNKEAILASIRTGGSDIRLRGDEGVGDAKTPRLLLAQGAYSAPLLLPEHCKDISGLLDKIILGDCLDKLKGIPDNSVDLIATDPPYGLKFMGKDWDKAVPSVDVWKECLRVLKPGAFAFVMSIPRQDCLSRMINNLEAARFRVDFTSIYWTYAQGFTKAQDVSKAIDKKLGAGRRVISRNPNSRENCGKDNTIYRSGTVGKSCHVTIPATPEAQTVEGAYKGFQPKPAVEVIIVAMKPMEEKTYIDQALSNEKGITWMDDCRIPYAKTHNASSGATGGGEIGRASDSSEIRPPDGRFPANLLISNDVLDDGKIHAGGSFPAKRGKTAHFGLNEKESDRIGAMGDTGGFSRFFSLDAWAEKKLPFLIVPKASKNEKNAGLENRNVKVVDDGRRKAIEIPFQRGKILRKNTHPTVKPIKLMSYLITMGSREGDVVLDPMCGSGTSCLAAMQLGRRFIGVEINSLYHELALKRLNNAAKGNQYQKRRDSEALAKTEKKEKATLPKIIKRGQGDYPRVYRPCRISEVYGQDSTKGIIANGLDNGNLPQVLLFQGVSGTGKTTLGRIIAMGLNCEKGPTSEPCCECGHCMQVIRGNSLGFWEFDAGRFSGVDDLRKERQNFAGAAIGHKNKIILFDECHRLSKEAQHVLLKPAEDVYPQTYFIFCTTDPGKIIETLRNRCMPFEFRPIQDHIMEQLLMDVLECEGHKYPSVFIRPIIEEARGRPRNALTLLQKAVTCGRFKFQAMFKRLDANQSHAAFEEAA